MGLGVCRGNGGEAPPICVRQKKVLTEAGKIRRKQLEKKSIKLEKFKLMYMHCCDNGAVPGRTLITLNHFKIKLFAAEARKNYTSRFGQLLCCP